MNFLLRNRIILQWQRFHKQQWSVQYKCISLYLSKLLSLCMCNPCKHHVDVRYFFLHKLAHLMNMGLEAEHYGSGNLWRDWYQGMASNLYYASKWDKAIFWQSMSEYFENTRVIVKYYYYKSLLSNSFQSFARFWHFHTWTIHRWIATGFCPWKMEWKVNCHSNSGFNSTIQQVKFSLKWTETFSEIHFQSTQVSLVQLTEAFIARFLLLLI